MNTSEYKSVLKMVNDCIYRDKYINYREIFILIEKYISNNQNLTIPEKIYLRKKLENSYENFIIGISKGNVNIFKYNKYQIEYEHIYRMILANKKNNGVKNKINHNIIHLVNGSNILKKYYKDEIEYLLDIM